MYRSFYAHVSMVVASLSFAATLAASSTAPPPSAASKKRGDTWLELDNALPLGISESLLVMLPRVLTSFDDRRMRCSGEEAGDALLLPRGVVSGGGGGTRPPSAGATAKSLPFPSGFVLLAMLCTSSSVEPDEPLEWFEPSPLPPAALVVLLLPFVMELLRLRTRSSGLAMALRIMGEAAPFAPRASFGAGDSWKLVAGLRVPGVCRTNSATEKAVFSMIGATSPRESARFSGTPASSTRSSRSLNLPRRRSRSIFFSASAFIAAALRFGSVRARVSQDASCCPARSACAATLAATSRSASSASKPELLGLATSRLPLPLRKAPKLSASE
mmetsp:Transcript_21813/g.66863  ORF Transcript_21813/g.66863 Transcript_21813/m.66863 type:complete len:330 (+) Transcript_21813:676-1665(+)